MFVWLCFAEKVDHNFEWLHNKLIQFIIKMAIIPYELKIIFFDTNNEVWNDFRWILAKNQITYLQNIPKNACVDFDASKIDYTSLF